MRSDYDNELVKRAVIHLKAGELDTARRYLERALDAADDPDTKTQASYWLSTLTEDPAQKRALLEEVLAYNRNHPEARRALAILDGKLNPTDLVDANALRPQTAPDAPQPAHVERFACPKCGARMVFAPNGRSLYCEHCTRREALSTSRGQGLAEQDFFTAMATERGHRKPVAMRAFACQGCGAEFVLAPEVISAACAYCGSPHVIDTRATRELLEPDAVIAFAFDQPTAARRLVQHVTERGITPSGTVQPPRGL
ncbi:MAG: NADH pyrophosphatase zinc ribbon domain-containing protein, partial [Anaerolineales bacterium]